MGCQVVMVSFLLGGLAGGRSALGANSLGRRPTGLAGGDRVGGGEWPVFLLGPTSASATARRSAPAVMTELSERGRPPRHGEREDVTHEGRLAFQGG
ncbi:hypothetical protein DY245_30855 [Streptomyces inhibens]|uniref:Uncharacterized protein n=1 Tax=Streptomyces inhibens TaxID=2293571 RepID=A0A371PW70_STRIH|nr:hypothetical protein DY245_30855 [Streptomyces inhibens]